MDRARSASTAIKAQIVDDAENRARALSTASSIARRFVQVDPWAERVAGADAHEFRAARRPSASGRRRSERDDRDWIDIGAVDDIPLRGARVRRRRRDGRIAVFRTGDDEVFALDDRCPHKGGPLSQGIVHGRAVTCPLHNWVISLETGEALGADEGCVRTHPGPGRRRPHLHRARRAGEPRG